MKSLRFWAAGAAALSLVGMWGEGAEAAGFASQQFGGEQGSVVATNPTALYYNPGALGFSPGTALGMYGSLAIRHATWTPAANAPGTIADPSDAQGANTDEAKLMNVFGGASAAGSTHIGNLVIGAGFFAPFYGISHWEKNDSLSSATVAKYPYAVDGSQRWYSIDGKMEILYFTAGAAYRLGPLGIGATANLISSTVLVNQAKGNQGYADTTQEGRAFLDAHGFNGSFAAGAMLEILRDQMWLAGSYQAQPGMGQQSLNGFSTNTQYGTTSLPFPVTFTQSLPDIFRAGLRVRPKGIPWEFRVFGDFTRWSKMQAQCVVIRNDPCDIVPVDGSTNANQGEQPPNGPNGVQTFDRRNWNNTWGARIGASYWVKPQVELFVGGGYETAAVPDSTLAPDLFDANNILMALGGRFALSDTLFLTASYTQIQYMNRDNTGKSTLNTLPNGVQISVPTVEEDGGGKYTQWIGIFTGNLEAMF
jgi:long-chain fatty acid transport protein